MVTKWAHTKLSPFVNPCQINKKNNKRRKNSSVTASHRERNTMQSVHLLAVFCLLKNKTIPDIVSNLYKNKNTIKNAFSFMWRAVNIQKGQHDNTIKTNDQAFIIQHCGN